MLNFLSSPLLCGGDILQVQEIASIILIQSIVTGQKQGFAKCWGKHCRELNAVLGAWACLSLRAAKDFICDVTSATVPVWSYHETVPSASLPYEMGYQADLNLNEASYTVMMWLKQGASEPDDAIIIGQHIGTSTTTTMTSVTVTETTYTASTTTTTQSTTMLASPFWIWHGCMGCLLPCVVGRKQGPLDEAPFFCKKQKFQPKTVRSVECEDRLMSVVSISRPLFQRLCWRRDRCVRPPLCQREM